MRRGSQHVVSFRNKKNRALSMKYKWCILSKKQCTTYFHTRRTRLEGVFGDS